MKELNTDNMRSFGSRTYSGIPTINVCKKGGFSMSKLAAALLDTPHLGCKFYVVDDKLYVSPSDDNNAFRWRSKETGAMMQNTTLAKHLLDMVDSNLYSATLEIFDKPKDGMYEININRPLRIKKGAPA